MSFHPHKNILKDFLSDVFIETGSYRGDGIKLALDTGFKKILSLDIDQENIQFCKDRFALDHEHNPLRQKIILVHGDTAHCLYRAITEHLDQSKKFTFWLDAHWQMFEDTEPGDNPFPLLRELAQIENLERKDHNILIDDMLIMQDNITGYTRDTIIDKLQGINSAYNIIDIANPVMRGIMAAHTNTSYMIENLGIGEAAAAADEGRLIARAGWNGKEMFVFKQIPSEIDAEVIPRMQSLPQRVKDEFAKRGGSIRYMTQLAIVYKDNSIHGWSPSPTDMMAKDWCILD